MSTLLQGGRVPLVPHVHGDIGMAESSDSPVTAPQQGAAFFLSLSIDVQSGRYQSSPKKTDADHVVAVRYNRQNKTRDDHVRERELTMVRGSGWLGVRTCDNLVLKLSKSGSGVWAPNSLSMDQNMEGWTNFYLSKTSKKDPYLTRGRK